MQDLEFLESIQSISPSFNLASLLRLNQRANTSQVLAKGNKWSLNPHLDELCVPLKIRMQIGVSHSIGA